MEEKNRKGSLNMQDKYYYLDGTASNKLDSSKALHREDGPAVEYSDGTKGWFLNGRRHRKDGPATEWNDGTKEWWLNGKLHRKDGPAIERFSGYKEWWLNGKLHREDGPAREYVSGTKAWYQNGRRHREDGPAVEYYDGDEEWWLNGERLKILSQEYLIRYMELTGECLASLLLSTDKMLRESTRKYKWKELDNAS